MKSSKNKKLFWRKNRRCRGGIRRFVDLHYYAFAVVLATYTAINVGLDKNAWDPYPFILLNLFLSMLAALQAPVIMMSQNRQDSKDRLRSELDFDVNRHSGNGDSGSGAKTQFCSTTR